MNGHDVRLGFFILPTSERDAVPIAIAPVVAGEKLSPGQHVGFVAVDTVGTATTPIGIIDPFLLGDIAPGAHCWLLLYPNVGANECARDFIIVLPASMARAYAISSEMLSPVKSQ